MSKLHLVFGGRVSDPQTLDFDPDQLDIVGIFPNYAAAEKAWRAAAQRTVDDAEMKYVVVHLHRLLEPEACGELCPCERWGPGFHATSLVSRDPCFRRGTA